MATLLEELGMGRTAKRPLNLAGQGNISSANEVIEILRRKGDGSLTTDLNLVCLRREAYREHIGFCLDSAGEKLDKKELDDAEKYLNLAKNYSLELNGRDVRDFLANGLPLYRKLDELRRAQA